ncbi:MAG: SusC/RagA family TonB-linked outer membrane protein [Bacteroidales bacterium]
MNKYGGILLNLCILGSTGVVSAQHNLKTGNKEKEDSEAINPVKNVLMDEITVVAYGVAKKGSLTGASSVITPKEITNRPVSSITSVIMGVASGVQSTLSEGQPGSSPSLRIRGFGSINASNEPLYVVDGTIYNGALSDINANDVASVTILKDAASTALYGSSAGNGVILITTKKANTSRRNQVTLRISQGFSQKGIPEFNRVNLWEYYPLQWTMLRNQYINGSGQTPELASQNASANLYNLLGKFNVFKGVPNEAIVTTAGILNPEATTLLYNDFDWEGDAFKNGYRGDYTLSYSTHTENSDTYASLNYLDDQGSMIQTGFKRYGARINYNINPVKWLGAGINLSANYAKAKTPMTNMTFTTAKGNMANFIRRMAPIYPVHLHNEDGSFKLDEQGEKIYDYTSARISYPGRHTIAEALWNKRGYTRDSYTGNTYVSVMPVKGLKITAKGAIESSNDRSEVYYNTLVADGAPAGRIQVTNERSQTYMFHQLIDYNKKVGEHAFELLLGHENYAFKYQYQYVYKQKQIMEGLYELDNFSTLSKLTSRTDNYKKEGYFGRLNYNFDDTYFLTASYRRDGSSRFSKDSRWGDFWSVGASWRIDKEAFLRDLHWIDMLKLRASFGETGNDGVLKSGSPDYYVWQTLYNTGINNSNEPGLYFSMFGNKNLKWETLQSADIAIEFMLLNRLRGSVEYFSKNSRDLLFNVPAPLSSGVASIWRNLGKVENKGWEINLNYDYLNQNDWNGTVGLNGTFLKNRVKTMPAAVPEIISNTSKVSVGHSIYDFWLRDYQGVNPANGDALYAFDNEKVWDSSDARFVEINGKRLTTDPTFAKYHYCGSSVPKFYGGLNTTLRYKDFTLGVLFSYGLGGKIYDAQYAELMDNQLGYAMHKDVLRAWKQEGDITDVPRLDASQRTNFGAVSDRFLVNGDYLNLQSIQLTYELPLQMVKKIGIEGLSFTLSGENLYQWNHRKGLNSVSNFVGYTYNLYAPSRIYTFNINFTL